MLGFLKKNKKHVCAEDNLVLLARITIPGPFSWTVYRRRFTSDYYTGASEPIVHTQNGDAFMVYEVCPVCKKFFLTLVSPDGSIPYDMDYLSGMLDKILIAKMGMSSKEYEENINWDELLSRLPDIFDAPAEVAEKPRLQVNALVKDSKWPDREIVFLGEVPNKPGYALLLLKGHTGTIFSTDSRLEELEEIDA